MDSCPPLVLLLIGMNLKIQDLIQFRQSNVRINKFFKNLYFWRQRLKQDLTLDIDQDFAFETYKRLHQKYINPILVKAIEKKKKIKIVCRNSFERMCIHQYAELRNIPHRSIINYNQIHINQSVTRNRDSHCCHDCDQFKIVISGTPFSFVEINNGFEKEIIGNELTLPNSIVNYIYGGSLTSNIDRFKGNFRRY